MRMSKGKLKAMWQLLYQSVMHVTSKSMVKRGLTNVWEADVQLCEGYENVTAEAHRCPRLCDGYCIIHQVVVDDDRPHTTHLPSALHLLGKITLEPQHLKLWCRVLSVNWNINIIEKKKLWFEMLKVTYMHTCTQWNKGDWIIMRGLVFRIEWYMAVVD